LEYVLNVKIKFQLVEYSFVQKVFFAWNVHC